MVFNMRKCVCVGVCVALLLGIVCESLVWAGPPCSFLLAPFLLSPFSSSKFSSSRSSLPTHFARAPKHLASIWWLVRKTRESERGVSGELAADN